MPIEMRRIVFSNDELRQALDAYLLSIGQSLPVGYLQGVRFGEDHSQVLLTIYDRRREQTHEAKVDAAHVAAGLMKFCFSNGIPIPKQARKSISMAGDGLALDVRKQPTTVTVESAAAAQ
jgi:hypothetical protein